MDAPVIASLVALGGGLLVFAGTQWITHWREETRFRRGKLEELLNLLADLRRQRLEWLSARAREDADRWIEVRTASFEKVAKINTLIRLHFPALAQLNCHLLGQAGGLAHLNFPDFRKLDHGSLLALIDNLDTSTHSVAEDALARSSFLTRSRPRDLIPYWIFSSDNNPEP